MDRIFYVVSFAVYFAVTVIFVFYIVLKGNSRNKLADFLVLIWFSTQSTYRSGYSWALMPKLWEIRGGDRLLSLFLLAFVILSYFSRNKKLSSLPLLSFEKYLYYYLFAAIVLLYVHNMLGNVNNSRLDYYVTLYFSALIMFYSMKKYVTYEFIDSWIKVVIFMGIITSIVGIVQFFIDSHFIRISHISVAIPGHNRSSGIFRDPGNHGLFLTMSIFAAYFYIQKPIIRYFLIFFFLINVLLVFSRGIWFGLLVCGIFHYFYFHTRIKKRKLYIYIFGGIPLFVTIAYNLVVTGILDQTTNVGSRVFNDTLTPRFAYYSYALKAIPEKLLIGFGDFLNNMHYFAGMVADNQPLMWALGKEGGIHNLILEEAYLRGVVVTSFFLLYFFHYFKFNSSESMRRNTYIYMIPNYFVLSFFIYELSVSGFLISNSGYLTIFFTSLSAGVYHKMIDVSQFSFRSIKPSIISKASEKLQ